MESAMVPSFFIFMTIRYFFRYKVRQMARHPRQIKYTPPIDNLSLFGLNIYRDTST